MDMEKWQKVLNILLVMALAVIVGLASSYVTSVRYEKAIADNNVAHQQELDKLNAKIAEQNEQLRVKDILITIPGVRQSMKAEIEDYKNDDVKIGSGTYADALGYKVDYLREHEALTEQDIADLMGIANEDLTGVLVELPLN